MSKPGKLSRRERQIMDVIYRLQEASAKEIMDNMDDPPGYSSVRTLIRKLEEKGHVKHRESGLKYVYSPIIESKTASRTALSNIVRTFFGDSPAQAVNSLLDMSLDKISQEELQQLEKMIKDKKKSKQK